MICRGVSARPRLLLLLAIPWLADPRSALAYCDPDAEYCVAPTALEAPPPGELADIARMVALSVQRHRAAFAARCSLEDAMPRDAHSKHHGCVCGSFEVDSAIELPTPLFVPGRSYTAWLRFSNSNEEIEHDREPAARGMAIKLMDVPGAKLLEGVFPDTEWSKHEPTSQDLLLSNHPVFFVKHARDYVRFTERQGTPWLLFYFIPFRVPELWQVVLGLNKKVYDPLRVSYHSMTSYLFGPGRAAKLEAVPVSCTDPDQVLPDPSRETDRYDHLREAMAESLDPDRGNDSCFRLQAWVRDGSDSPPIEDPTRAWGGRPVRLGLLTIPRQRFDSGDRTHLCENLSMTPWHAVPEHQPLGGINRVRLRLYHEISSLRHQLNREPAIVPAACEVSP